MLPAPTSFPISVATMFIPMGQDGSAVFEGPVSASTLYSQPRPDYFGADPDHGLCSDTHWVYSSDMQVDSHVSTHVSPSLLALLGPYQWIRTAL